MSAPENYDPSIPDTAHPDIWVRQPDGSKKPYESPTALDQPEPDDTLSKPASE